MRKALFLSLFLVLSIPSITQAANAHIGSRIKGSASGGTVSTDPFNNIGSTICYVTWAETTSGGAGLAGLSDSEGNVPKGYHVDVLLGTMNLNTAYFKHPVTSTNYAVTITGNHLSAVAVQCFSSSDNDGPLDTRNTNVTSSGTSLTTGSVTPDDTGNIAIAAIAGGNNSGVTVGSSFTGLLSVNIAGGVHWSLAVAYKIGLSGSENPTFNWSGADAMVSQITSVKGNGVDGVATWPAATCENKAGQLDIQAAIDRADTGDLVTIPAGTCTITTGILFNKAVTLQCNGVGSTILRNGMGTLLAMLIGGTSASGQLTRVTGCEFNNNGGLSSSTGALYFAGIDTFRFDHNKLDHMDGFGIYLDGVYGVMDHNTFLMGSSNNIALYVFHAGASGTGAESWYDPINFSGGGYLFNEDNTFTYDVADVFCTDGYRGTRMVNRFNHTTNCKFAVHGTESGYRGGVIQQTYANDLSGTDDTIQGIRSGTGFIWGNTNHYTGASHAVNLSDDRTAGDFMPLGAASGHSVWDVNDNSSMPYISNATATGGSALTVTVSGAGWTPSFYVGFSIQKTSACIYPEQCYSLILANTTDTMTVQDNLGFGSPSMNFTAGETFSVYKLIRTMDQPGVVGGSFVTGGPAPTTPPAGWNNQVITPIYQWLNTGNGADVSTYVHPTCLPGCHANEEYYDYTASFTGAAGVGAGTRMDMDAITNCVQGVGFWVNDEGAWNDGSNMIYTGQGRFYICDGSNHWVLSYTPYQYPHPLVTGIDTDPPVPSITSIAPTYGIQGQSMTISVVGNANTGWVNGYTFATFTDNRIVVTSTTCSDNAHCTVGVYLTAPAGIYGIAMTTVTP